MSKIQTHPILEVPRTGQAQFLFKGNKITGQKGFTIASALHQAGYPVHSISLKNRNRSLECGIGKCGACEMLVDGQIKRICITKVDHVKEVSELPRNYTPKITPPHHQTPYKIYKTTVAIIGAGPAGLDARQAICRY